jgi:hypothetical protein
MAIKQYKEQQFEKTVFDEDNAFKPLQPDVKAPITQELHSASISDFILLALGVMSMFMGFIFLTLSHPSSGVKGKWRIK